MSDDWKTKCVYDLFDEQAAATPDRIAVVYEDEKITYKELQRRSCILGRKLQDQGVGPDVFVALLVEKSVEMMIGMLGISKAGGAYVPIDPQYPQDRIEYILEDSGANLLLMHEDTRRIPLPDYQGAKIFIDNPAMWAASEPTDFKRAACPSDLIYMIYTSGTTGKPKGVEIMHHGVVNMILHFIEICRLRDNSKGQNIIIQFFKQCFDGAVAEYFPAICSGGTLVLYRGSSFAATITKHKASHIFMTPSAIATLEPDMNPTVRSVCVGGEACPVSVALRWARPGLLFNNIYGPTGSISPHS